MQLQLMWPQGGVSPAENVKQTCGPQLGCHLLRNCLPGTLKHVAPAVACLMHRVISSKPTSCHRYTCPINATAESAGPPCQHVCRNSCNWILVAGRGRTEWPGWGDDPTAEQSGLKITHAVAARLELLATRAARAARTAGHSTAVGQLHG